MSINKRVNLLEEKMNSVEKGIEELKLTMLVEFEKLRGEIKELKGEKVGEEKEKQKNWDKIKYIGSIIAGAAGLKFLSWLFHFQI